MDGYGFFVTLSLMCSKVCNMFLCPEQVTTFFVTLSLMFKGMQCVFMSRTGYNILAAYSMPALTLFSISCVAL
jgi:hypothetical protein